MDNIFVIKCHEGSQFIISSGKRLTIENAAEFCKFVRETMASAESVQIEFDPDLEADVTALQILCSTCKTAAAEGKTFAPHGAWPDSLKTLITSVGAEFHGNCRYNNDKPCSWFGVNQ